MSTAKLMSALLLCLSLAPGAFADTVADSDLKAGLVGSWVDPPESTGGSRLHARQVFNNDGTTFVYLYATAECREPVAAIGGTWAVVNGTLITQVTGTTHPGLIQIGQIEQVNIVEFEANRIVMNADEKFYVREKSETCFRPGTRRT